MIIMIMDIVCRGVLWTQKSIMDHNYLCGDGKITKIF